MSWRVPAQPMLLSVAYYASCALAHAALEDARVRRAAIASAAITLVAIAAPLRSSAAPSAGRLRISLIDVGQGDAILIQPGGGPALLIDTGGSPGSFDIGARVVTPAAWALGSTSLGWLVLSHGDRDHIGGAASVIDDLAPSEIWEGVPVPPNRDLQALQEAAAQRGLRWRSIRAGHRLEIGPVAIEAVHPPEPDWERQRVRNDDSIVLRVRYGRVEFLMTGDAGAEFEQRLPADLGTAPIRILKAGHHGSRTSSSDALIRRLRPQVALISVGRNNLFGHPAADVLRRLSEAGAETFRTDRDGAISVETDGRAVRVLTSLGRQWMLSVWEER
jgi:competence protein ComEC